LCFKKIIRNLEGFFEVGKTLKSRNTSRLDPPPHTAPLGGRGVFPLDLQRFQKFIAFAYKVFGIEVKSYYICMGIMWMVGIWVTWGYYGDREGGSITYIWEVYTDKGHWEGGVTHKESV